jgi:hypothetical protein
VAVWSGREVLVVGGKIRAPNQQVPTPVGGAYDPENDTWRLLSPPPLVPYGTSGAWVDGRLLVYDTTLTSASFDPSTDRWTHLPKLPIKGGECPPAAAAATGQSLLAYFCGQTAVWDGSAWIRVSGGPMDESAPYAGSTVRTFSSASLSAAGPVVVFDGIAPRGPCYTCQAAPHPFWVYRPGPTPS